MVAATGEVADDLVGRASGPEAADMVVVGVVEVTVVPGTAGEGAALIPALLRISKTTSRSPEEVSTFKMRGGESMR